MKYNEHYVLNINYMFFKDTYSEKFLTKGQIFSALYIETIDNINIISISHKEDFKNLTIYKVPLHLFEKIFEAVPE